MNLRIPLLLLSLVHFGVPFTAESAEPAWMKDLKTRCKSVRELNEKTLLCEFCENLDAVDECQRTGTRVLNQRWKGCTILNTRVAGPAKDCDPMKGPHLRPKECKPGLIVMCKSTAEMKALGAEIPGAYRGPVTPAASSSRDASGSSRHPN